MTKGENIFSNAFAGKLLLALPAFALAVVVAPPAHAFDHCQNYADVAVQQQGENLIIGCGYSGWRWHGWREGHYNWCKGVSFNKSRKEINKRALKLAQCRFG